MACERRVRSAVVACIAVLAGCATRGGAPAAACPQQPANAPIAAATEPAPARASEPAPEPPPIAAQQGNGLDEIAALTARCPKAALNAAAREAAKVPSEGSYQFSRFELISNTHQAVYEIHFVSNYPEEPVLRYCVAIYCQNGWDPKVTQPSVTLLREPAAKTKAAIAEASCGGTHTHAAARRLE